VLTTRREAISLYRDVVRYSRLFVWKDELGRMWRDVIRSSARQEFELARNEQDPEVVNRLLVSGRDALHQTMDRFLAKREQIIRDDQARSMPSAV
jgi:DNA primase large subunit